MKTISLILFTLFTCLSAQAGYFGELTVPAHSYFGNNTGSNATVGYISQTQLTADLNAFTNLLQGMCPASGGGAVNFLRADGTWAAPVGTTYTFADSLVNTAGTVKLVGDVASPTASQYYGTNAGSVLGYYNLPSGGTVTTVSVVSANGLAGTVANATTTPAITLSTSITGLLKGNGTSISAAVSSTDYAPATSGSAILKGNGSGGFSSAVADTDYQNPISLAAVGSSPNANAATFSSDTLTLQPFSSTHPGVVPLSGGGSTNFLRADGTWAVPSGGGGSGVGFFFVLEDATVPWTTFNGVRAAVTTETLSAVTITMGNSGTSGSTQIQVNDLTASVSATASLSASSGSPASSSSTLSSSLSITAGDVLSVDVISVAGGSPSDLTVSFQ